MSEGPYKTLLPLAGLAGIIILLPFLFKGDYFVSVMILVAIYAILAMGMGLLIGQAGLFSLAHPVWFGLGAYISGILAVRGVLPVWATPFAAALGVGCVSYLVGTPVLRLRSHYLACCTLAILLIAQIAAGQLPHLTGGHEGLLGIPLLSVFGFEFKKDLHFYFLSWALCLFCYWFLHNLVKSQFGRAVRSFNDNETASASMGVNIARYKVYVFVLTAVMAGLAGSVFCFYLRLVIPSSFDFPLLVQLLMMIVIGGLQDLHGPLIGSFAVIWLGEFIKVDLASVFPIMTSEVEAVFFGAVIVVMLIFMPDGLTGWINRIPSLGRKVYERTQASSR
jgi:branched-chain amino acid transport system permease protein